MTNYTDSLKELYGYDPNNIFARIIRNEVPCNKVFEDEAVIAFHDICPVAKIHIIVIPKTPYISFDDFMARATPHEAQHFFYVVRQVARLFDLNVTGYRIASNHGEDAMQTVTHFHMHILGKERLGNMTTK